MPRYQQNLRGGSNATEFSAEGGEIDPELKTVQEKLDEINERIPSIDGVKAKFLAEHLKAAGKNNSEFAKKVVAYAKENGIGQMTEKGGVRLQESDLENIAVALQEDLLQERGFDQQILDRRVAEQFLSDTYDMTTRDTQATLAEIDKSHTKKGDRAQTKEYESGQDVQTKINMTALEAISNYLDNVDSSESQELDKKNVYTRGGIEHVISSLDNITDLASKKDVIEKAQAVIDQYKNKKIRGMDGTLDNLTVKLNTKKTPEWAFK